MNKMDQFTGFDIADFDTFSIDRFEERMESIKTLVRPKLEAIGQDLAPALSDLTGHPMHPITAKHLRRKVNPPNDTWVAWSASKRGYKMLPHFQLGLWRTHAFIQAGVIYEAQGRAQFADLLLGNLETLQGEIPGHFRWMEDYTRPDGILQSEMTRADFERIAHRLRNKKEADCMVGLSIDRADVVAAGSSFAQIARQVMQTIFPIYLLASAPVIETHPVMSV